MRGKLTVFLFFVLLISLTSCNNNQRNCRSGIAFTGLTKNRLKVLITEIVPEGKYSVDTLELIPENENCYELSKDVSSLYQIRIKDKSLWLILEPGKKVTLDVSVMKFIDSPQSSRFNILMQQIKLINDSAIENMNLYVVYDPRIHQPNYRDSILSLVLSSKKKIELLSEEYIRSYPASPASLVLIFNRFGMNPVFNVQTQTELFCLMDRAMSLNENKSIHFHYLKDYINKAGPGIERQKHLDSLINNRLMAPHVSLPDHNGVLRRLEEFKGKNLVLFFWAAGEPYSLSAFKSLLRYYPVIRKNNYEILGISFDQNAELWKTTIANASSSWINLHEPGYPNSETASNYCVEGRLPLFYILDTNGNFVNSYTEVGELLKVFIK